MLENQVEPKASSHIGDRSCQLSIQGVVMKEFAQSPEF